MDWPGAAGGTVGAGHGGNAAVAVAGVGAVEAVTAVCVRYDATPLLLAEHRHLYIGGYGVGPHLGAADAVALPLDGQRGVLMAGRFAEVGRVGRVGGGGNLGHIRQRDTCVARFRKR
jgi:hypothetical protein